MKIRSVEPFILHVPLNADSISDSTHTFAHWGVVGTKIVTENGLAAHAALARSTPIPIALGEQLYTADAFSAFIAADAIHYAQPDVTRVGGITEYIQVAHTAHAHRLPVIAHVGDMGQVHVHLSYWHPATPMLEYIPWIKDCFAEPIRVEDGHYHRPQMPGAGCTLTPAAVAAHSKPCIA